VAKILLTGGMPLSQAYPIINSNINEIYNALGIGSGLDLHELADVYIDSPVEKQFLQWDPTAAGGAGRWVNSRVTLNEIDQIIITGSPTQGETIKWNGTNWVNSKVGVGELNNVTLGTLGAGQAKQVLQWNGTNWTNSYIDFNELTNSYVSNTGSVGEVIKWSASAGGAGVAGYVDGFLSVDELGDVTISSVADEDVLIYNSTASQWQNKPQSNLNIPQVTNLQSAVNRQIISSIMGVL
jgi:hypothetical protein